MAEQCGLKRITDTKLKLRDELTFSLVKEEPEKIYTLYDPYNDRYFQFKEYEYVIAGLMDGQTSSRVICQKFEEQFDAELPLETLEVFARKLFALGLIEGAPIPPKIDKYSGVLFKKFKLFNPDKLFDAIIDYVRFLFHPLTVKIFVVVLFIAGYLLLKRWNEVAAYGMPGTNAGDWSGLGLIVLIIIAIISTHEFAHGLSLKNYGGKVPEMGFMLMIFIPAFYCDVSDAWKLSKNKKLFVTFAGGFYELVVGAFAVIIWNFADPYLWLSDLAYLVMVSSVFTIGINFNPLLRLDGYYLLSDWLEMPNLRSESIKYFMRLVSAPFKKLPPANYTLKEKIIYPVYAVLSTLFIMFMISIIYSLVSGWLIDTFRLPGVLLSIFILIFFLSLILKGIIKPGTNTNKTESQKA